MDKQEYYNVQDFNCIYKELDDLYHDMALKIGISDSALTILYTMCKIGDGCLQRDICNQSFSSKQTINSAIRKLENEGYLYLKQGKGRDKHIYLTDSGMKIVREKVCPIIEIENAAFSTLTSKEQEQFISIGRKYVEGLREKVHKL